MADLFGGIGGDKTKKQKETDGTIKRCFEAWAEAYERKWRIKAKHLAPGRSAAHFKALVAAYGEKETIDLIEQFFATGLWRVVRGGYTVGEFFAVAPELVLEGRKSGGDKGTTDNIDAARRATRQR